MVQQYGTFAENHPAKKISTTNKPPDSESVAADSTPLSPKNNDPISPRKISFSTTDGRIKKAIVSIPAIGFSVLLVLALALYLELTNRRPAVSTLWTPDYTFTPAPWTTRSKESTSLDLYVYVDSTHTFRSRQPQHSSSLFTTKPVLPRFDPRSFPCIRLSEQELEVHIFWQETIPGRIEVRSSGMPNRQYDSNEGISKAKDWPDVIWTERYIGDEVIGYQERRGGGKLPDVVFERDRKMAAKRDEVVSGPWMAPIPKALKGYLRQQAANWEAFVYRLRLDWEEQRKLRRQLRRNNGRYVNPFDWKTWRVIDHGDGTLTSRASYGDDTSNTTVADWKNVSWERPATCGPEGPTQLVYGNILEEYRPMPGDEELGWQVEPEWEWHEDYWEVWAGPGDEGYITTVADFPDLVWTRTVWPKWKKTNLMARVRKDGNDTLSVMLGLAANVSSRERWIGSLRERGICRGDDGRPGDCL